MLKLNLGSGQNPLPGFVNVDKEGNPDLRIDLEMFPWCPVTTGAQGMIEMRGAQALAANCADEVVMNHVLEHLGRDPNVFIGIMKELYRICAPNALVRIAVPHPRHDNFIGDPTHVRVITPEVLSLFSKRLNLAWQKMGASNTPLALYHGIDFEIVEKRIVLEKRYHEGLESGAYTALQIDEFLRERNNVASEIRLTLSALK